MYYSALDALRDKLAFMEYAAAVEQANIENDILASYYGGYNPYLPAPQDHDKIAISLNYVLNKLEGMPGVFGGTGYAGKYGAGHTLDRILSNPSKYPNLLATLPFTNRLKREIPEYELLKSWQNSTQPTSWLSKIGLGRSKEIAQRTAAQDLANFTLSGYGKGLPTSVRAKKALEVSNAARAVYDDAIHKGFSLNPMGREIYKLTNPTNDVALQASYLRRQAIKERAQSIFNNSRHGINL